MLKIMKMKSRKMKTLAKSGSDLIKADTSLLIDGMALIERKGLSTLRVLKALTLMLPGKNSKSPVQTTKKSITFHPSLRYDFL